MKLQRRSVNVVLMALALLLVAPIGTVAQTGRPAVEYHSLLNMGFAEADGELLIDSLNVLFPPTAYEQAVLTVSTAAGEEVATVSLRLDSYLNFPVFSRFVPEVRPATIKLRKPGDFTVAIKIADDIITKFPLSVAAEPTDNPYERPTKFLREGPWRDFAYFSTPAANSNANLRFNWWMSTRELPVGMKSPAVTIHLVDPTREIAFSSQAMSLESVDWQFFSSELTIKKRTGPQQVTMSDLVKRDCTYLLIVKADGVPVKSFHLEARDGRLQRPEQSRIGFQPHSDFMSPRFIESGQPSGSKYLVNDAYWVRRSGVRRSFPPVTASVAQRQ